MLIWEITWKLSRSNATSTWSIEWNMTKKYHAYSYTMFFMILNVFFFWLQTISPSLLTASSFQLLCRSHVVTAYDPNLGQGEVRNCWMMEKKLFCYNFFGSLHKIVTDTQQWEMSIFTDTSAIFDPKSNEGLCRSRCLKHLLDKSDAQLPPTPPLPPIPYFSWARFERAAPFLPSWHPFSPPLERVIKPLCRCPPSKSRQCLLSCREEESGNPASSLIRKRLIDSILYSDSNIQATSKICKTGNRISFCKTKMTNWWEKIWRRRWRDSRLSLNCLRSLLF